MYKFPSDSNENIQQLVECHEIIDKKDFYFFFYTSNSNKKAELDDLLPRLNKKHHINVNLIVITHDINEIQSQSTKEVVSHKIQQAMAHFLAHEKQKYLHTTNDNHIILTNNNHIIFCEDTGLGFKRAGKDGSGNYYPGALIKFPYDSLRNKYNGDFHQVNKELVTQYGNDDAVFSTSFGYYNPQCGSYFANTIDQKFSVAETYSENGDGFDFDFILTLPEYGGTKSLAELNRSLIPKPRAILFEALYLMITEK